ncbi:MAG: hypothetical protein IV085_05880 [Thiobacillus sp.]|nr:hypothetical protein [Thiobacillus sp.]
MTTKTKGRAGCHQATQNTTDRQNLTALTHRITILAAIKRRIWLIGYDLEETRQIHAVSGHFWKQAGVCITLALLRLGRLA